VWRFDLASNHLQQLTFDGESKRWPVMVAAPLSQQPSQPIYLPIIIQEEK